MNKAKKAFEKFRSNIYIWIKMNLMYNWSDKAFVIADFFYMQRKFLNLKNPKTFSEKLQWIKVYGGLEKYSNIVDKYMVRSYIKKIIGAKYLIPLIGRWKTPSDINFTKLPNQFVLKSTHGSQHVFVCLNKSDIVREELVKKLNGWLEDDFYKKTREIQYKNCSKSIIAEKLLRDDNNDLVDYKFYCFNGKPHMVMVVNQRFGDKPGNYFFLDLDWNIMEYIYKGYTPEISKLPQKPETLSEMIDIAKRLSKKFPFVRVDLYSVNGNVYFGELTFIPSGGLDPYHPYVAELELGNLLNLEFFKKRSTK